MTDLPPAVQSAIKEQTKNATLVGLEQRKRKNGKTTYEAETTVNVGKSRDPVSFETVRRHRVAVEQEVDPQQPSLRPRKRLSRRGLRAGTLKKVESVQDRREVDHLL